nr:hypothetical protein [candidate division Zixibacteria bacterium]
MNLKLEIEDPVGHLVQWMEKAGNPPFSQMSLEDKDPALSELHPDQILNPKNFDRNRKYLPIWYPGSPEEFDKEIRAAVNEVYRTMREDLNLPHDDQELLNVIALSLLDMFQNIQDERAQNIQDK